MSYNIGEHILIDGAVFSVDNVYGYNSYKITMVQNQKQHMDNLVNSGQAKASNFCTNKYVHAKLVEWLKNEVLTTTKKGEQNGE